MTATSLVGSALSLLLAVRLAVSRTENRVGAWTLAAFMVCAAMLVIDSTFYRNEWFARMPWFYGVANPFIAATGPVFYVYACAATDPSFRWRARTWLHLIPSALFLLLEIPVLFLPVDEKLRLASQDLQSSGNLAERFWSVGIFDVYLLIYFGLAWWRFWRRRDRMAESREEGRSHPLRFMGLFATVLVVLNVVSAVLDFTPWMQTGMTMIALAGVIAVFAAFWTVTNPVTLVEPRKSVARSPAVVAIGSALPDGQDVEASTLTAPSVADAVAPLPVEPDPETQRLAHKLTQWMEAERPYLDAALSLQTLADRLGTTRHRASEAIKHAYAATFYQVMAVHRVREAARVLATREGQARTIADVAFSSGFNTLSAFNTAFRAEFGMTPKAYRQSIREQSDAGAAAVLPPSASKLSVPSGTRVQS